MEVLYTFLDKDDSTLIVHTGPYVLEKPNFLLSRSKECTLDRDRILRQLLSTTIQYIGLVCSGPISDSYIHITTSLIIWCVYISKSRKSRNTRTLDCVKDGTSKSTKNNLTWFNRFGNNVDFNEIVCCIISRFSCPDSVFQSQSRDETLKNYSEKNYQNSGYKGKTVEVSKNLPLCTFYVHFYKPYKIL